ncbi:CLUMA_CG019950, isoform A [Clunio marinus]|uniref:CLUMA_CG019950, isoform A n=1 Tax=Clunio marinus TaxID=568069 RepID=A0A1J1J4S1_9DIPT|nr:CLUMA_CG019950, isoform A [Clunio marinus]
MELANEAEDWNAIGRRNEMGVPCMKTYFKSIRLVT